MEPSREQVEKLFGDWTGNGTPPPSLVTPPPGATPTSTRTRRRRRSSWPIQASRSAIPNTTPRSAPSRFSRCGMGVRLFTEVRKKARPLCGQSRRLSDIQGGRRILCLRGHDDRTAPGDAGRDRRRTQRMIEGVSEDEVQRVCGAELVRDHARRVEHRPVPACSHPRTGTTWPASARRRDPRQQIEALSPASILDHVKKYPPAISRLSRWARIRLKYQFVDQVKAFG